MKSRFAAAALAAACPAAFAAGGDPGQEAVLDTIAQMNHINWVVNVIKTYENPVILEKEYEKISYGNLDLNRIPDEESLQRIKDLLDTLENLRSDDRKREHWKANFEAVRRRNERKFVREGIVRRIFPSAMRLFDSAAAAAAGDVSSVLPAAESAIMVAAEGVGLYFDYDDYKNEFDLRAGDEAFNFEEGRKKALHEQNKKMLDDQWRLVKACGLEDAQVRTTDTDVKRLLDILRDGNPDRIYTRLLGLRERYRQCPEFWYHLSCAALCSGHFKEGVEACDRFFAANRGILRDDPMVPAVAVNKASMLDKTDANRSEMEKCIDIVDRSAGGVADWRQNMAAAAICLAELGDAPKAARLADRAAAALESDVHALVAAGGDWRSFAGSLDECHALVFATHPGEEIPEAIRASEYSTLADAMRSVKGKSAAEIESAVETPLSAVRMYAWKGGADGRDVMAEVRAPIAWTLCDGCSLELRQCGIPVAAAGEPEKIETIDGARTAKMLFRFPGAAKTGKGCTFGFSWKHKEFPATLVFASASMPNMGFGAYRERFGERPAWLDDLELRRAFVSGRKLFSRYPTWKDSRFCTGLSMTMTGFPRDARKDGIDFISCENKGGAVAVVVQNVSDEDLRPFVKIVFLGRDGEVLGIHSDEYYDEHETSFRTVKRQWIDGKLEVRTYLHSLAPGYAHTVKAPIPEGACSVLFDCDVCRGMEDTFQLW